jgi:hypothetical protein
MLNTLNTTLADLIKFAYDLHPKQVDKRELQAYAITVAKGGEKTKSLMPRARCGTSDRSDRQ